MTNVKRGVAAAGIVGVALALALAGGCEGEAQRGREREGDRQARSAPTTRRAAPVTTRSARRASTAPRFRLGVNLDRLTHYASQWAFVDVFKSSQVHRGYPWRLRGSGDPPPLDAEGYPVGLADGQSAATLCMVGIDGRYPGGRYTLEFRGKGSVELSRDAAHTRFEHDGRGVARHQVTVTPSRKGIDVRIVTSDPSDHVRGVRLVMPGFAARQRTAPFHPLFLSRLTPFEVLRFMDWGGVNGSRVARWEERRKPSYRSMEREVAYEHMLQLSNTLRADPWICVPHRADDDFVDHLARLVRDRLDPELRVFVELSNEVWNPQFLQHKDLVQDARAGGLRWYQVYAQRSARVFERFVATLGEERVVRVLGTQAVNPWLSARIVASLPPGAGADALAIAPYFSAGGKVNRDPSLTRGWQSADVLVACRQDLERLTTLIRDQRRVAKAAGLRLIAYEGGQHLVARGAAANEQRVVDLFAAANRDPEMHGMYRAYLDMWSREAGELFCHYAYCSRPNKWGSWGALEYQDQRLGRAPKYRALVQELRTPWEETEPLPAGAPRRR